MTISTVCGIACLTALIFAIRNEDGLGWVAVPAVGLAAAAVAPAF